jgi:hypothetical protein
MSGNEQKPEIDLGLRVLIEVSIGLPLLLRAFLAEQVIRNYLEAWEPGDEERLQ